MLNIKDIGKALRHIAEEKNLPEEKVLEAIEYAIATAYKKEYGGRAEIIKAKLGLDDGDLSFWKEKTVVDDTIVRFVTPEEEAAEEEERKEALENKGKEKKEEPKKEEISEDEEEELKLPRYNSERHMMLDEAQVIKPDVEIGEVLTFPLEAHEDFGRIAAQAAKQVVMQRLRESERTLILDEWRDKEGDIVSGTVQRYDRGHVYIDFGRATGIMFFNESIQGEHYRTGDRLRFLVLAVQEDTRMPGIVLSRAHPDFVRKLFELEVPELTEGSCEIKAIAREAGSRSKVAVTSTVPGIDPIGSFVGQRGTRVMAVTNELGLEKIDIIDWSEEPETFIAHAVSPAQVNAVETFDRREARVFVPEDQLSLAIGKGGQNVRLAAKLTGWKIDVRSSADPELEQTGGIATSEGETLGEIPDENAEAAAEKEETKEAVSIEEVKTEEPTTEEEKVEKETEETEEKAEEVEVKAEEKEEATEEEES